MNRNAKDNCYYEKDYRKFRFLNGNRTINEGNVRKIVASLQKYGWVAPIIVDKNLKIIDGQHRFEAAKRLEMPIYYTICGTDITIDGIMDINQASKKWTDLDKVRSRASTGDINFKYLCSAIDRFKKTKIRNIMIAQKFLGTYHTVSMASTLKQEFKCDAEQYDRYCAELEKVNNLLTVMIGSRTEKSLGRLDYYGTAIMFMMSMEQFDYNRFETRLKSRACRLAPVSNAEMALRALNEIYNFNLRGDAAPFDFMRYWSDYMMESKNKKKANS